MRPLKTKSPELNFVSFCRWTAGLLGVYIACAYLSRGVLKQVQHDFIFYPQANANYYLMLLNNL